MTSGVSQCPPTLWAMIFLALAHLVISIVVLSSNLRDSAVDLILGESREQVRILELPYETPDRLL